MTPDQVIAELAGDLPPATLVLGPGSWPLVTLAAGPEWLLRHDLSAGEARQVRESVWLLPCGGVRVVALCLDKVTAQGQNMLLKVLEEPPPGTRFVLAAESRPLPTVVSRCRVLVVGQVAAGQDADPRDRAAVATVLRAARSGQSALLAQTLRNWLPVQAKLLTVWAAEAASGQWKVFDTGTAPGVSAEQAMRLLTELARYPGAKLGALVALESVFSAG
jgi:DNA polymerase III, delta subunit